jgi:hypothetical protein
MVALRLTDLRRFDTHRLLPAKYSPNYDSALTRIADDDESIEFAEIDWKEREEIGYDDYLADFTAAFHGSQQLGVELLELGSLGIIIPASGGKVALLLLVFAPALLPMCARAHVTGASGLRCGPALSARTPRDWRQFPDHFTSLRRTSSRVDGFQVLPRSTLTQCNSVVLRRSTAA